jgi:hypothetical protein
MDLETIAALSREDQYKPMQAAGFDLHSAYFLGEQIAKKVGDERRIDFYGVVKSFGGTLHIICPSEFKIIREIFENSIYIQKDSTFDILLPANQGPAEYRYTLAHELGHFIMHKKPMSYACRNGNTPVEQEANTFALGLLMPSERFKNIYEQIKKYDHKIIPSLSSIFHVPEFAVEARLKSLGYSTE